MVLCCVDKKIFPTAAENTKTSNIAEIYAVSADDSLSMQKGQLNSTILGTECQVSSSNTDYFQLKLLFVFFCCRPSAERVHAAAKPLGLGGAGRP